MSHVYLITLDIFYTPCGGTLIMYTYTLHFMYSISFILCRHCVTPQSRGYGDVTVTYIRRSEIPSCIYAKHQCKKESEYGSTVVIYIPTEKYKYMVITDSDTILQEYYITRKIQKYIIRRDIHNKSWEMPTSSKRGLGSQSGEELRGKSYGDDQTSAALRSPWKDPLRTLISYSKATIV